MTLWLVLFAVTAVAMVLLVAPLWRRKALDASRAAFDAQVYRDQLVEIERDAERGTVTAEQAASARTEIGRRLLATQEEGPKVDNAAAGHVTPEGARSASNASRRGIAAFVAVAVPAAAVGVYLLVGSPHLPGRPAAEIRAQLPAKPATNDMQALVAELGDKLKARPDDLRGWSLYAQSLARVGRFEEAVGAYRKVTSLAPRNAELMSRFAEVQIFAAKGTVTPAARKALQDTLALDGGEPRARYYLGLAESQAGKVDEALAIWLALEAGSGPDAAWGKVLGARIATLAASAGISPDQLAARRKQAAQATPPATSGPTPPGPTAQATTPGPTAEDVEAAQSMSQQDRTEMIRGMVARLAERLENEPDDVAGWQRLARSYAVLGEAEKARDAHARLATLRPDDVGVLADYAAAIARTLPRDAPIPAELVKLGDRILALDPRHTGALWFTGLARVQAGDANGARDRWTRLLALLDPQSPQHAEVRKSLEALGPASPQ